MGENARDAVLFKVFSRQCRLVSESPLLFGEVVWIGNIATSVNVKLARNMG